MTNRSHRKTARSKPASWGIIRLPQFRGPVLWFWDKLYSAAFHTVLHCLCSGTNIKSTVFYFGRSPLLTRGTEISLSQWRELKYETLVIFSLLNQRVLDYDPLWSVSVFEHFDSERTRASEVQWVLCGVLSICLKNVFLCNFTYVIHRDVYLL
jgi:hypothetical protein